MDGLNETLLPQVHANSSSCNAQYPNHAIVFHTMLLTLGFLIVINNVAVICLYQRRKELQHWSNFLLICLATTDFLAGFLNIPFIVAASVLSLQKANLRAVYFLSSAISDFVIITNVLTLFLIFTERYLSICCPVLSRSFLTFTKIRRFVALIWITAFTLAVLPLCWSYKAIARLPAPPNYYESMHKFNVIHSLFVSISCFILPSGLILFYSVAVLRVVVHVSSESSQKRKAADRRRAFCLLFAMFMLLLCAWSPLITIRFILDTRGDVHLTRLALEVIVAVRFITSFVNPFIYSLLKDDFRKPLLSLFDTCRPSMRQEALLPKSSALLCPTV